MRLLVVEDDPATVDILVRRLRKASYAVDAAMTCCEATDLAIENEYDAVVLDLELPDGFGLDLLKRWRQEGFHSPTLILSARGSVEEKVEGLDAGADDYLPKPFDFPELLARLRCLMRRRDLEFVQPLTFEDVSLERDNLRVRRAGVPIEVTAKEFALLEFFVLHAGAVLTRTQIAEHVWDDSHEARSNVIDVLIGRLRRKLESQGERLIFTIKGLGYVLRTMRAGVTLEL